MWGISQATGISIEKLAYDNNIQNIDLIFAGDVLILKRDGDVPAGYHVTGNGHVVHILRLLSTTIMAITIE